MSLREPLNLHRARMSRVPMQKCDIEIPFVLVRDFRCRKPDYDWLATFVIQKVTERILNVSLSGTRLMFDT